MPSDCQAGEGAIAIGLTVPANLHRRPSEIGLSWYLPPTISTFTVLFWAPNSKERP
jgi:hypothetical protein